MIKQAAIRQDNSKIYTTPRPGRHDNIIREMIDFAVYDTTKVHEHGFLTEDDQFVDRVTAFKIAMQCGQIEECLTSSRLYSEDLW